jgi:prevent-host-death family protein
MRTVAVVEAKSQFSALLAAVESGEEVAITRRGRVIARLVPDTARSAADVFRVCWQEGGLDLEAPPDTPAEPVADWD